MSLMHKSNGGPQRSRGCVSENEIRTLSRTAHLHGGRLHSHRRCRESGPLATELERRLQDSECLHLHLGAADLLCIPRKEPDLHEDAATARLGAPGLQRRHLRRGQLHRPALPVQGEHRAFAPLRDTLCHLPQRVRLDRPHVPCEDRQSRILQERCILVVNYSCYKDDIR